MATPSLSVAVPEDMQAQMAASKAPCPRSLHSQHGHQDYDYARFQSDLHHERRSSCSSISSTSSSGCSSASSGLAIEHLAGKGNASPIRPALEGAAAHSRPVSCPFSLPSSTPPAAQVLPRGDLLILGGDLAYPNPSNETYENRFFR